MRRWGRRWGWRRCSPLESVASLALGDMTTHDTAMLIRIPVPNDIREAADEMAGWLGVSRSELYARAVAEYLAHHRDEVVTARLNEVYAEEVARFDAGLRAAQARSVGGTDW